MPYYDYECVECDNKFEEKHSIDERNKPTEKPCSSCGGEVKMTVAFPGLADPIRLGLRKPDDGFKDMMKRMKRNVPGGENMNLNF